MNNNKVTIVIDFKIYAYLFEPILSYLIENKFVVYIYIPNALKEEVSILLPKNSNIIYCDLDVIKKNNRIRFILHRTCSILFTKTSFSFQFKKKREQSTKKFVGVTGLLLNISKFTPKVPNRYINKFLSLISGFNFKNPFPTEYIMVGSLNASGELLSAKGQKVVTVMESWDHAVKEPNGYESALFLGWNRDLCEDWRNTQHDENVLVLHPLKLRYAHEIFSGSRSLTKNKKFKIMYPASATKKFSIGVMVELDYLLITNLIEITKLLDWDLFIKPRPNGLVGEFDYAAAHQHVTVGEVSHGDIQNPANYFYTDEDNRARFDALNDVDMVVNAFTTFALDSASAGVPVLQLDLRKCLGFEKSYMVYNNYHIKNYLISSNTLLRPEENTTLKSAFLDNRDDLLSTATQYTEHLQDWLYKYNCSSEAIENCFKHILDGN